MLYEYFARGTEATVTGGKVGIEIETDFVDGDGWPISDFVQAEILACASEAPHGCVVQRELGRQKIELAIGPCESAQAAMALAWVSLGWLYSVAAQFGARPVFAPDIGTREPLLNAVEPRDEVWAELDGRAALEELCRCSSVQFTVDVNPRDAVAVVNALWASRLHRLDYAENDARWRRYLERSQFGYGALRYAGPQRFADLADYARRLETHPVLMHHGRPVRQSVASTPGLDVDLFLRSVWWHYRLRRYGDSLTVEIRPLARREDAKIAEYWQQIAPIFALAQGRDQIYRDARERRDWDSQVPAR